jgi:hypothetical protein
MSNRIRIARIHPQHDVPQPVLGDMAGHTGSPDTRHSNSLHTRPLKKRGGPNFTDANVTHTTPLGSSHDPLYMHGNDQGEEY